MSGSSTTKVLIIDDEKTIHGFVGCVLLKNGFQIHNAYNGQEGLDLYQKCNPDLVILDIKMPNVDSAQFLTTIKKKYKKLCPVVVISGGYEKGKLEYMESLGICAFLEKPFRLNELQHTIDLCLNSN